MTGSPEPADLDLGEVVARALQPRVGIPINPVDLAAADVRRWAEGHANRMTWLKGVSFGIKIGREGPVSANRIAAIVSEAERKMRAKGGRAKAEKERLNIEFRRNLVRDIFRVLPKPMRIRPTGKNTINKVREFLSQKVNAMADEGMLDRERADTITKSSYSTIRDDIQWLRDNAS